MRFRLCLGVVVLSLLLCVGVAFASEQLKPAEMPGAPNPEAVARTMAVVMGYAQTHDVSFLAEDVVFTDMSTHLVLKGFEAVSKQINTLYGTGFSQAWPENRHVGVGDGFMLAHFVFHGVHTGVYDGIPPTGHAVAVPMVGVWEVRNGKVASITVYYNRRDMHEQLGIM